MPEEKIIQFQIDRKPERLEGIDISEIKEYRLDLLRRNLIGKLTDEEPVEKFRGKDCGNISIRKGDNILISGSQTSSKQDVTVDDFVLISHYIPEEFLVKCRGLIDPSSETPMHWSSYKADKKINAVIHAHIFNYDPLRKHVGTFFKEKKLPVLISPSKYTRSIEVELVPLVHERGHENVIGLPIHDGGYGLLALGENMKETYERLINFHLKLAAF